MNQFQFSLAVLASYVMFPASFQLQISNTSSIIPNVWSDCVWSDGGNIISSDRQSISPANFIILIFQEENILK